MKLFREVAPFRLILPLVLALASFACDTDEPTDPAACDQISAACHDFEKGPGVAHDCHEVAHDKDAKACTAKRAACLAFCLPMKADAGGDVAHGNSDASATGDGGADAGHL